MKPYRFALFVLGFTSQIAFANGIEFGEATYSGDACPPGSMNIHIDSEHKKILIDTQPIEIKAGYFNQLSQVEKKCEIQVPVRVQRGLSLALSPVELKGYVKQSISAHSQLFISYLYDYEYGTASQKTGYKWPEYQNQSFLISAPKSKDYKPFWTNCGDDFTFRMQLAMKGQISDLKKGLEMSLEQIGDLEFQQGVCTPRI